MSFRFPSSSVSNSDTKSSRSVTVEIGEIPILLQPNEASFCGLIEERYEGFLNPAAAPYYTFDVQLISPSPATDEDARVSRDGPLWLLERGDFRAQWDVRSRRGWLRQAPNPYSIDTVLRIAHSLALADEGGFLLHASSAVSSGRAFIFAGISGAGKTTMARLAPPDATVLTDEISYVRRRGTSYRAYGTPFAGELARVGANVSAPIESLYLLEKGLENRIEPVDPVTAARSLLRHILFFAHDPEMVQRVFESALEFVSHVHVARLIFTPEPGAWKLFL